MNGHPGHNTRLYALLPPYVLGIDALMTSQLSVALIRKLCGSLAYFDIYPCTLVQPGTSRRPVDRCRN